MLFDSHAHLDDRAFDLDRSELIRTLPERGIGLLMDPGCSLAASYAAGALAEETPWIYAAAGSHPDAADEVDEETLDAYRANYLPKNLGTSTAQIAQLVRAHLGKTGGSKA